MSHLDFVLGLLNVGIRAAQFLYIVLKIRSFLKNNKSENEDKKNRRS